MNLALVAQTLVKRGIDIAPTRLSWLLVARDCACAMGEAGRQHFYRIASVWPDYNEADSQRCYDEMLRKATPNRYTPFIRWACRNAGLNVDVLSFKEQVERKESPKPLRKEKERMVNLDYFLSTQLQGRQLLGCNALTDMLLRLFDEKKVHQVVEQYAVGFESLKSGIPGLPILFWQIDENMNIVNAKRMQYKADGHRNKDIPPRILFPANPISMFGIHRIQPGDEVGIVESEKSALVMSLHLPDMKWLAVGGLNFFNENTLEPIYKCRIFAFPDLDATTARNHDRGAAFVEWNKTAIKLRRKGWDIQVSDFLERRANSYMRMQKLDIADYVLEQRIELFKKGKLQ